jgi:hypothetical protein
MRFCRVKVDAVTLFEHYGLATDVKFHLSLKNKVELLPFMGVLVDGMGVGLRLDSNDKHICLMELLYPDH